MTTYAINAITLTYDNDFGNDTLSQSVLQVTYPDSGPVSYDFPFGTAPNTEINPEFDYDQMLVSGALIPMSAYLDVPGSETLNSDHFIDMDSAEVSIVDFVWSGNRTTVLVMTEFQYDDNIGDSDTFFVLNGPALPSFTDAEDLYDFISGVTFRTPRSSNPFGPDTDFAIDSFGALLTEDDFIIDTLTYTGGNSIDTGIGDDVIVGLQGDDLIDGEEGFDTVRYDLDASYGGNRGINGNLDTKLVTDGFGTTDSLFNIEEIIGTDNSDSLIAGDNDVRFEGRSGSDTFFGGTGTTEFDGGNGTDTLTYVLVSEDLNIDVSRGVVKGAGRDTFANVEQINGGSGNDFIAARVDEFATLSGLDGDDVLKFKNDAWGVLFGNDGNDKLVGAGLDDELDGGAGDDVVIGNDGQDMVFGGDGSDYVYGGLGADSVEGNDGNDFVRGNRGADLLLGGDGDDDIEGGADNDYLDGGNGIDVLEGGNGLDELVGGSGNDYFYGGGGADIFSFYWMGEDQFDRIQDFEDGTDTISLIGYGFDDISDFSITSPSAGRVVLDLGDGRKVNINGIDVSDLSNDDFSFEDLFPIFEF
ncbi:calcium-binding protein [Aliishimia ponticola]|uniref:Calcium-binding protein n=1 Tax=Aliishimia ponticola TaxID=2499833 RepID=A0A4S4ND47_9RHOB|nr:calcium-binding protein [Aliishimia ponticola]THH37392.1 calcium-binding protein [Aliishimia ponticola]